MKHICGLHGRHILSLGAIATLLILAAKLLPLDHYYGFSASSPTKEPLVAICLMGGARHFEITGYSLRKYVLDQYKNAHIFLHSPLDKDTYKLLLMDGDSKFAAARVFTPYHINETDEYKRLLNPVGSPNGIQGLLQYFNLVEGCWQIITNYESHHHIQYDWIIRTRIDTYWNGPLPPITHFSRDSYTIPSGSHFGGINDRLGVGNRSTSKLALERFSAMSILWERGFANIHSELAFVKQIEIAHVKVEFQPLPFCILSHRFFPWPPGRWEPPIVSMNSTGDLGGAYCRPCTPALSGPSANAFVEGLDRWAGWFPNQGKKVELCNGTQAQWEPHWENMVDEILGHDLAKARWNINNLPMIDCELNFYDFQHKWDIWDGPSFQEICLQYRKSQE